MFKGKRTCKILKEIRRKIAEDNDIAFITEECQYQGDCNGTCPKCEAELRYLEEELRKRQRLGKAVTIAGLSVGMATATTGCATRIPGEMLYLEGDVIGTEAYEEISTDFVTDTSSSNLDNLFVPKETVASDDTVPPIIGMVENLPSFPCGFEALENFLEKETHYPASALADSIQGVVLVEFVVKEDGQVADPKVKVSLSPDCDAEALRVIMAMPKWKPGCVLGKAKPMYYQVPVKFNITEP